MNELAEQGDADSAGKYRVLCARRANTAEPIFDDRHHKEVSVRLAIILAILMSSPNLAAHPDHEMVFSQASELLPWCKPEAEAYYAGRASLPINGRAATLRAVTRFASKARFALTARMCLSSAGLPKARANDMPSSRLTMNLSPAFGLLFQSNAVLLASVQYIVLVADSGK